MAAGVRLVGPLGQAPVGARLPWRHWPRLVAAGWFLLIWGQLFRSLHTMWAAWGLFLWVGRDFALYYAQAVALRSGGPAGIYDLAALNQHLQPLAAYAGTSGSPLALGPVPYPPIFAWALGPLTLLPPPVAFALWTALNAAAALFLARRCARLFPPGERLWVMLVVLASISLIQNLLLGQVMVLQACAIGEFYLALRAGRDFRAGLWLAGLFLKPHYGLLLGPFLLWKRRWATVAGAAAGLALVVAGSVLVAGLPAVLAYPQALADLGGFRTGINAGAEQMINWRAIVLYAAPAIGSRRGLALTTLLGMLTVLPLMPALRGRWAARERLFPYQVTLLLLATLLVSYHSHAYGAVLLAVPLASVVAEGRPYRLTSAAVAVMLFAPTVVPLLVSMLLPAVNLGVAPLMQVALLTGLAALLVNALSMRGSPDWIGADHG